MDIEPLLAKNVLGELTLEEVLDLAEPNFISVTSKTPYDTELREFRGWKKEEDSLLMFYEDVYENRPDYSLRLDSRVKVVGTEIRTRRTHGKGYQDLVITFHRLVPVDFSGISPSSNKPRRKAR